MNSSNYYEKVFKNFYWFSKKDLEHLIKKKNILNMDTISVFSSFIKKNKKDYPIQKTYEINEWIKTRDKKYNLKIRY